MPSIMGGSLIFILGSVVVSFCFITLLYRRLTSPLRSVGGPLLANFTDAWYCWRLWLGNFQQDNQDLHRIYGTPVTVMMSFIVLTEYLTSRTHCTVRSEQV